MTTNAVRGDIREDPQFALDALTTGMYDDTIDSTVVEALRREAQQGINGRDAAIAADEKAKEDENKRISKEAISVYYPLVATGVNSEGVPVNNADLIKRILYDPRIDTKNKDFLIENIRTRVKGEDTKTHDESVAKEVRRFLPLVFGTPNADGVIDGIEDVNKQLLDPTVSDILGQQSVINLIKINKNRGASPTESNIAENEMMTMILTGEDADGNALTNQEMINIISKNDALKIVDGAGSKKSFITMVNEKSVRDTNTNQALIENDIFNRIHLPPSDPKHVSSEDLTDPTLVKKLGTRIASSLKTQADKLADKKTALVQIAYKNYIDQFKRSITRSMLGKINDVDGDLQLGNFKQEVLRRIELAENNKQDPLDLFDNTKPASYLGQLANYYRRSTKRETSGISTTVKKSPITTIGVKPIAKREGETPSEYLARARSSR